MSDVPEQAGAPAEGEQGNADAAGAADSSGLDAGASVVSETGGEAGNAQSGTSAESHAGSDASALTGETASDVAGNAEQGNAAAGESQSSQLSLDSGESTLGGELPNGVSTSLVARATPVAMVSRVEAAALHAYQSGNTTEHNLMAWLHTHLTGAKAATAGAESLEGLTPEAKSILADLKTLL
jgi:hypothetical protein